MALPIFNKKAGRSALKEAEVPLEWMLKKQEQDQEKNLLLRNVLQKLKQEEAAKAAATKSAATKAAATKAAAGKK